MNKKKIVLFIIIGIVIVILLLLLFIKKDDNKYEEKLINYIVDKGFVVDDATIYKYSNNNFDSCTEENESNCESKSYFFNVGYYDYFMNERIKYDGVFHEFIPSYNYLTKDLRYTYHSSYNNGVIMYYGNYDGKDNFTCINDYTYGINADKDIMCDYIKEKVISFYNEAELFITDTYLLTNMK